MIPFLARNSRGFSLITVIGFVSVMIIMSSGVLLYWSHVRQNTILSSDSQKAENLAYFGQRVMKSQISTERDWLLVDTSPSDITIDGGTVTFELFPIDEHQIEIHSTGIYNSSSVTVERVFNRRTAVQFYTQTSTENVEIMITSPNIIHSLELHPVVDSPEAANLEAITLFWEPEGTYELIEVQLDGIPIATGTYNSGEEISLPAVPLTLGITQNMDFIYSTEFFGTRMTGYIRFDDQSVDVFDATF